MQQCSGIELDYLGTGINITPGSNRGENCRPGLRQVWKIFRRVSSGHYDWLILPAVNFQWPHDPTRVRRWFRRSLRAIKWHPFGGRSLAQWIIPRKTRVGIVDRFDSIDPLKDYADAVGASVYFKTNVLRSSCDEPAQNRWHLKWLPLWIREESYPKPDRDKEFDLFYAAGENSEARRNATHRLDLLRANGVRVFAPKERLPQNQYIDCLGKALLTLSPEGHGYHCFRHYEAMMMQSVPVINQPRQPLVTDLVHEKNCLLYDDNKSGELVRVILEALKNREHLANWGKNLRQYASDNCSMRGVGNYVLSVLSAQQ